MGTACCAPPGGAPSDSCASGSARIRPTGAGGELHRQLLAHTLAAIPVIGRAFSRGPYPAGGDVNTIWQGAYAPSEDAPALIGFSPGYRQVLDLGRWDRSTFQLPTGQSGIPGHPRYDDSIEEFRAGRQRPLLYSREAVEAYAEHRLLLQPAATGEGAE
ncbi:MAG: penicillin acylase family protein [Chloroflexi bacterium]|nr:penicillin acylase family protein [Chloroflexota bacterium]